MSQRFRQGDVNLEPCSAIPKDAKRLTGSDDLILAFGEATGHHHRLMPRTKDDVAVFKDAAGTVFLQVFTDVPVRHEEHSPNAEQVIVPGIYRMYMEIDFDPWKKHMRRVID